MYFLIPFGLFVLFVLNFVSDVLKRESQVKSYKDVHVNTDNDTVFPRMDTCSDASLQTTGCAFLKAFDSTFTFPTLQSLLHMSESVGALYRDDGFYGTGFRVGSHYIMTAYHVLVFMETACQMEGFDNHFRHILRNKNVRVTFYLQHGSSPSIFHFENVVYHNPALDIAVVKLNVCEENVLPERFSLCDIATVPTVTPCKNKRVHFVGYTDGKTKCFDFHCEVSEIEKHMVPNAVAEWRRQGVNIDLKQYEGLSRKDETRIFFQCSLQHGASGSPGVVTIGNKVYVCTVLLKGHPDFYYDMDKLNQLSLQDSVSKITVEEGVNIKSVYEDMKTQLEELYSDIFRPK